ncbi:hypothetical protein BA939_19780 [Rhizobium sp. S41]|nr:hypothetical protein BA939_19780 [Rhizobium sp. S41]KGE80776.1 hypothetical protein LW14_21505 [Rhizobium sp. H41]
MTSFVSRKCEITEYSIKLRLVLRTWLVAPVFHKNVALAAHHRCYKRVPGLGTLNMGTQDQCIALLRNVHTIDVDTQFFRQANPLGVTGLKYAGDMGHGSLPSVFTAFINIICPATSTSSLLITDRQ